MNRKRANLHVELAPPRQTASPDTSPISVLKDLFDLLEEYAPMWYTEELHDRAVAALSFDKSTRSKN